MLFINLKFQHIWEIIKWYVFTSLCFLQRPTKGPATRLGGLWTLYNERLVLLVLLLPQSLVYMKTDFSMENLVTLEFELGHVYNFLNFRYATIVHTLFITFYKVAKLKSVKYRKLQQNKILLPTVSVAIFVLYPMEYWWARPCLLKIHCKYYKLNTSRYVHSQGRVFLILIYSSFQITRQVCILLIPMYYIVYNILCIWLLT